MSAHWLFSVGSFFTLALVMASCGDDGGEALQSQFPETNLSESEISALHDVAGRLDVEGVLRPAVPLYIPAGLERMPFQADGSEDGATLVFGRGAVADTVDASIAVNLDISQGFSGATIVAEPPFVDLDGVRASAQMPAPGDSEALYALTFTIDNRDFLVSVTWHAPGNRLTDDMKDATETLARSIIADLYEQDLPTVGD